MRTFTNLALLSVAFALVFMSTRADAVPPGAIFNRGDVIVKPMFGGEILGYDIDPNGSEGVFSESLALPGGQNLAATETFDQSTGKIIKVVAMTRGLDDFATQGVFGHHVGLVLHQHAGQNKFRTMDPLNSNGFTGDWTPPLKPNYGLWTISRSQGTRNVAAYEVDGNLDIYVFGSNIEANTFGPPIHFKRDEFIGNFPLLAYDSKTNQAILSGSIGCRTCAPVVATVDLMTGKMAKFTGLGLGSVDGIAVDPATNTLCTTTLIDGGVEFYDLTKQTGFEVEIPNGSELDAGLDVEFDPIHDVFLVEQYSSTGNPSNPQPRIYVYDEKGNVQETIAVQRLPISPSLIALNPQKRIGFISEIVEPQHMFLAIQSFNY
ncbi:MAG TPA: hypothetical protein VII69_03315 [Candidatus Eremiobacteraceae bacterium]